jgi:hypothetical protein
MEIKQIEIEDVVQYFPDLKDKTKEEAWDLFWEQHEKMVFGYHFQGYDEVGECDPTEVQDYLDNLCK